MITMAEHTINFHYHIYIHHEYKKPKKFVPVKPEERSPQLQRYYAEKAKAVGDDQLIERVVENMSAPVIERLAGKLAEKVKTQ